MTEPMQVLFDYVSEKRTRDFLRSPCVHFCGNLADERETALLDTFTDTQRALWDQWYDTQMEYDLLYEHALFQAAFALAKELG